jgi:uncharacterized membrane protein YsdA (DUF1294 family)/cold shock CspA family protein
MRLAGRISNWNDDKGFGFVMPHDGGIRAFVHIKAFQFGSRRPVDGDLISYETSKDAQGRINAINARFAGQKKVEKREPRTPLPRLALGVIALLAILAGALRGIVPAVVPIGYLSFSVLSYLAYRRDKSAAGKGMQRTPEGTLHFVDLLGGWPGALIAQQQFRHKTVKASFQSVFWCTVLANVALVGALVHGGLGRVLMEVLR